MGWIEEHQEHEVEKQRKRFYFGDAFSEQLEKWKRITHKTEKDFAKTVGVHPNMVTKWKQGKGFPQAANMEKICSEFGIDASVFNPFTDFNLDYVKNAGRKERSKYLQMYADENGLDEEFYAWMIKQPGFVRVFPFHSIEKSTCWENVMPTEPDEKHPDEKPFPLLKFEFEDDYGHRKMMVKEDLDFILDIQEDVKKRFVFPVCLAEKEKVKKQRIEIQLQKYAEDYPGIDLDDVKRRCFRTNFVNEELGSDTADILKEIIKEVAEKAGIRPRISVDKLRFIYDENTLAQMFRDQGFSEEEIQAMVDSEIKAEMNVRKMLIDKYRREGYIIEEEESDNG